MKSGNLNFLEASGPLQACNGTASLFFTFIRETNRTFEIFALIKKGDIRQMKINVNEHVIEKEISSCVYMN
jgi:hypothetical protein